MVRHWHSLSGEALGALSLVGVQGWAIKDFWQPDPVGGAPAQGREVGIS